MWPLLYRDGLALPYAALCLGWAFLMLAWVPSVLLGHQQQARLGGGSGASKQGKPSTLQWLTNLAVWLLGAAFAAAALGVHVAERLVPPPERLPWLWDRAFITLSFAGLALGALHLQVRGWRAWCRGARARGEGEGGVIARRHVLLLLPPRRRRSGGYLLKSRTGGTSRRRRRGKRTSERMELSGGTFKRRPRARCFSLSSSLL